jgi:hypothetical protein
MGKQARTAVSKTRQDLSSGIPVDAVPADEDTHLRELMMIRDAARRFLWRQLMSESFAGTAAASGVLERVCAEVVRVLDRRERLGIGVVRVVPAPEVGLYDAAVDAAAIQYGGDA